MEKKLDLYLYDSAMYARFAFLWKGGGEGGKGKDKETHIISRDLVHVPKTW